MNIEKLDRIKSLFNNIDKYKKDYYNFLKQYNIDVNLFLPECKIELYKNYRTTYIHNRNLLYLFNEKLEPLKKYRGEVELEELNIQRNFSVSVENSNYNLILNQYNKLIEDLNNSKLLGLQNLTENEVWSITEETIIELNEIVDVNPIVTKFYMETYIPFFRELFKNNLPSGQMEMFPYGNPTQKFLLLMNELISFDSEDNDRIRERINHLLGLIRQ